MSFAVGLALTPICPFRPRRWRGALIGVESVLEVEVLDPEKPPVGCSPDNGEVKDVHRVRVYQDRRTAARVLFDPDHSLAERVFREQFAEAKRLLDDLVEHAPEEYRESMLKNVRLNREIMEAWEEHGEKAVGEGDAD